MTLRSFQSVACHRYVNSDRGAWKRTKKYVSVLWIHVTTKCDGLVRDQSTLEELVAPDWATWIQHETVVSVYFNCSSERRTVRMVKEPNITTATCWNGPMWCIDFWIELHERRVSAVNFIDIFMLSLQSAYVLVVTAHESNLKGVVLKCSIRVDQPVWPLQTDVI